MRFIAVLRTFRKTTVDLGPLLDSLRAQTRSFDRFVIVENNVTSLIDRDTVAAALAGTDVDVICLGENRGPAGATEFAFEKLAAGLDEDDFIVIVDDDIPLPGPSYLERLVAAAHGLLEADPNLGAVGRIGHHFDWDRGRLVRPSASELHGLVAVDYLATGYAPAFRVKAIRASGGFRGELFVGLTEVEFGLRLGKHGFNIYAVADLWGTRTAKPNLLGVTFDIRRPRWRRYYTARNLVVILREGGRDDVAVRASLRSLAGSMLRAVTRPGGALGDFKMTARGLADGWRGRLGRRVTPD